MDPGLEKATTVFLSYARADQKRVLPLIDALEQAGIEVWWDGLLEGGESFLPTTEAALESADAVVVLWSRTSVDSHWVRDEATRGRDRGCLVPLTIDGTEPPLGFRQIQCIDISKGRGRRGSGGGGTAGPDARSPAGSGRGDLRRGHRGPSPFRADGHELRRPPRRRLAHRRATPQNLLTRPR